MSGVWIVTGTSASGKTTVAGLLVERFERSVMIEGDVLRTFVRRGFAPMTPDLDPEGLAQLALRHRATAQLADLYAEEGFTVVVDDILLGASLERFLGMLRARPRRLVVLAPRADVVVDRNRGRAKNGYARFTVEQLDRALREETPRIGLWLDSSEHDAPQTVAELLRRQDESHV
jgi:predicted kinase